MMRGFSFGSYVPGKSPLHALDARAKLVLGCAFIIITLNARDFPALVPVALFVASCYALARIPAGKAVRSLAPLMFIVVIASIMNLFIVQGGPVLFEWALIRISEQGVYTCLLIAARLVLMMAGMSLVTLTTTTLDLTEAFERLLSPLARFGVPAHEIGMIMGIALRFMPQFATELSSIREAQLSRGAGLKTSPVRGAQTLASMMTPLFASVFRHAETLSAAMDARCYHGKVGRTRLHPLRFAPRDGIACVCTAALLACVVAVNVFA